MSRLDRQFSAYRDRAMAAPMTKASQEITPEIELTGGITLALSLNK